MSSAAQSYASLEYLDIVLDRLFDYLESNGMFKNTYVMLVGDNG